MTKNQCNIPLLVAIVLFLGTVAPVIVSAEDSAAIVNSVYSSTETGGKSQSGVAGQDGQDGRNGAEGSDGADGTSGQSGASSAAASVTNHVNGSESHTVTVTATSGVATVQTDSAAFATTTHYGEEEQLPANDSSEAQAFQLFSLLLLLRETLTAYVHKLF